MELQDLICLGLFIQAHQSYKAIRVLVNHGLPADAFSVIRSMVEMTINGAYVRRLDADAAFDFVEFTAFKGWRDYQALRGSSPEFAGTFPNSYVSKMKVQFDRLSAEMTLNRFGRGHDWTNVGLRNRAELVDQNNAFLGIGKIFNARILYDFCYRESAPFVHGLFPSIKTLFKFGKLRNLAKENGFVRAKVSVALRNTDPCLAKDALACSNFVAVYLLFLADGLFNQSKHCRSIMTLIKAHYSDKPKNSRSRRL